MTVGVNPVKSTLGNRAPVVAQTSVIVLTWLGKAALIVSKLILALAPMLAAWALLSQRASNFLIDDAPSAVEGAVKPVSYTHLRAHETG